ncbi:MAG TPA: TSUP family transporter [Polyangiaceae bacterium]|nr:TSUP family transporter [Polyangiaceae bacterium]
MLVGVALGLLGGGGSLLSVPVLVVALGLDVRTAIATSLVVVGFTSIVALVPRIFAKQVDFKAGLTLGAAGMIGAYVGGKLARHVPSAVLMLLFAGIMLATAAAMFRERPQPRDVKPSAHPIVAGILRGVAMGLLTGLVGAGGGFLVVPTLVLFARLEMPTAVGTSLLVIAMQSFAGFAGSAGHVSVPLALAGSVAIAAAAGAVVGQRLSRRFEARTLRRLFASFVLVAGTFTLAHQLPDALWSSPWFQAAFVQRWPGWLGGIALATVVVGLLYFENRLLGVSTGCAELCESVRSAAARRSWRLRFLAGILAGGVLAAVFARRVPSFGLSLTGVFASASFPVQALALFAGGVLVGAGARLAGGCTSGHAIVGVAQGARASFVATACFMAAGFVTTWLFSG